MGTRLLILRRAAVAVALVAAFTACTDDDAQRSPREGAASSSTVDDRAATHDADVRFIESNSGTLKEGIVGMVMSFALESTDRPLNITAVEPVADAGLKVTYLGYS